MIQSYIPIGIFYGLLIFGLMLSSIAICRVMEGSTAVSKIIDRIERSEEE